MDNGRVEHEDLHTSVTSDGVGCADAIHLNTIISTCKDVNVAAATSD